MEQEIHITLRFNMATGKVNFNEIVYRLKELQNPLMLKILDGILRGYDDLISERLSQTKIYPSKARKGLGRHLGSPKIQTNHNRNPNRREIHKKKHAPGPDRPLVY